MRDNGQDEEDEKKMKRKETIDSKRRVELGLDYQNDSDSQNSLDGLLDNES